MKNKGYLGLLGIPLAVLSIVGSVASAQSNTLQSTLAPVQTVQQVPADNELADQNEQVNTPELQAKAKISADQAKKAAEAKIGGTATGVVLTDDDGTVVYEVTIGAQDVTVNATDGSIIKVDKSDGAEQVGDHETNDGPDVGN